MLLLYDQVRVAKCILTLRPEAQDTLVWLNTTWKVAVLQESNSFLLKIQIDFLTSGLG